MLGTTQARFVTAFAASAKSGLGSTAKAPAKPKVKPLSAEEKKAIAAVTAKVTALNSCTLNHFSSMARSTLSNVDSSERRLSSIV